MTTRDPLSPQWEDCKVCGGDHWTKDHPDLRLPPGERGPIPAARRRCVECWGPVDEMGASLLINEAEHLAHDDPGRIGTVRINERPKP